MTFENAKISDLIICKPNLIQDDRGFFYESFRKNLLEKHLNYKINFCQENFSKSKYGVFRGFHFQIPPFSQSKLVSVVVGKIQDIAIDLRKKSENYGKVFSIILDDVNHKSLFIPKGFAHGFLTLSETAIVGYKIDNYYKPDYERGLNFNDPKLKFKFEIEKSLIITSQKDSKFPNLKLTNYFD